MQQGALLFGTARIPFLTDPIRQDHAGCDRVDGNARRPKFAGELPPETDQPGLCCGIMGAGQPAGIAARNRSDIDDAAESGSFHHRDYGAAQRKGRLQIDINHPRQIGILHILKPVGLTATPCIVDKDVDRAKPVRHRSNQGLAGIGIGHIAAQTKGQTRPAIFQLALRGDKTVRVSPQKAYRHAARRKSLDTGQANTCRAPGHNRRPPLHPSPRLTDGTPTTSIAPRSRRRAKRNGASIAGFETPQASVDRAQVSFPPAQDRSGYPPLRAGDRRQ